MDGSWKSIKWLDHLNNKDKLPPFRIWLNSTSSSINFVPGVWAKDLSRLFSSSGLFGLFSFFLIMQFNSRQTNPKKLKKPNRLY
jgi:hypothetical protein